MSLIQENTDMKKKFIVYYITCLLEAVAWGIAGALLLKVFQLEVSRTVKIAAAVFLACCLLVGEGIFCFIQIVEREKNNGVIQDRNKQGLNTSESGDRHLKDIDDNEKKQDIKEHTDNFNNDRKKVTSLVLLSEQGGVLLEWSLQNKTALIIGRNNGKEMVDVDLSGSAVADMISKQHAVLNYTDNGWYVDDIDSKNGTRVKKKYQSALLDVKLVGAVEVEPGDIIYIANAMLQIR